MATRDARNEGETLRAELRELGYLENPLSRFFAGGLSRRRPVLRTHLRVGIGVGLSLGLLAVLLSLPVVLVSRGIAGASRDLLLLFVVFGFLSALLCGLLSGVVIFLLSRLTRRLVDKAELAARSTAVAAFGLAFLYLISYWRQYGGALAAGSGMPPALVDVLAAIVVVLVALLTARLFHLATFAVLTSIPGFSFGPRRRGARRALLVGVGLSFFAFAAAVFSATPRAGADAQGFRVEGSPIEVKNPPYRRVVLLALDGLDWQNARAAMENGWMPELARIAGDGYARPLATEGAIHPAFWTTVTTGLSVSRHRIDSFSQDRVVGLSPGVERGPLETIPSLMRVLGLSQKVAVTGSMSRVKHVADVVEDAGQRAASVNVWATYPAEHFRGSTVSDRAHLELRAASRTDEPSEISDPRVVSPPELLERSRSFLADEAEVESAVPEIAEAGLTRNHATTYPVLNDLFVQKTTLELIRDEDPHFVQVCLTGLDKVRHSIQNPRVPLDDVNLAGRFEVLRGYYRFVDRFIGRLAAAAGEDSLFLVATYPGIARQGDGLLVVSGKDVRRSDGQGAIRPDAIAPTLLFALGLPASEEQDGGSDMHWFVGETLARAPSIRRMVPAFGLKPPGSAPDASSDRRHLQYLREFGYF